MVHEEIVYFETPIRHNQKKEDNEHACPAIVEMINDGSTLEGSPFVTKDYCTSFSGGLGCQRMGYCVSFQQNIT